MIFIQDGAETIRWFKFNAKVERENIFKPTIGNENLHQDCNDNDVRIVNFTTSKNLVVKSMMFLYWNIHKYTWNSPDGKTQTQTDHILTERWEHSCFKGADCDADHNQVVTKVREKVAESKQAAQKFDVERFNLEKLNELEVKKRYQSEISNRFAALGCLSESKDINRALDNIREHIKTSAKESLDQQI